MSYLPPNATSKICSGGVARSRARTRVQRHREAREYDQFLHAKVAAARRSMRAGIGQLNDEVETQFAAQCAELVRTSEA